jgi:hypothetical protein
MQALARLEGKFTDRPRVPRLELRTESLAAHGATPGKQAAAALGGHAGTKTMGARAVQIAGIECTFHGGG